MSFGGFGGVGVGGVLGMIIVVVSWLGLLWFELFGEYLISLLG